jgi:hypothetical protein
MLAHSPCPNGAAYLAHPLGLKNKEFDVLKRKCLRNCIVYVLFSFFGFIVTVSAHEGHDHAHDTAITIEKKTYIHFQTALLGYQYIYSYMVKGGSNDISDLAQNLIDAASQGVQTEPEGPGQHMMQHILEGAESLKNAKNVNERQEAFASISDTFFSYFKSWSNQLIRNRLKMCRCKSGHRWLQPENSPTACPYSLNKSANCLTIEETVY